MLGSKYTSNFSFQVNDLSLEQLNRDGEEEFLSDISFDEEHLLEGCA